MLKFTTTKWIYNNDTKFPPMMFKFKDDSLIISCETNDLSATVFLWRRKSASSPYTLAQEYFKQRITVVGQTFHVSSLSLTDSGFYACKASNDQSNIELELGQLIISASKQFLSLNFNSFGVLKKYFSSLLSPTFFKIHTIKE